MAAFFFYLATVGSLVLNADTIIRLTACDAVLRKVVAYVVAVGIAFCAGGYFQQRLRARRPRARTLSS